MGLTYIEIDSFSLELHRWLKSWSFVRYMFNLFFVGLAIYTPLIAVSKFCKSSFMLVILMKIYDVA